ncbi:MAG: hypothetical protein RR246_00500 [Clostridia bacterium]
MPLSEQEIKNLLSLDDTRLREIIFQISAAVGASAKKTQAFTNDLNSLKSKIAAMSPDEINMLLNKVGKEKSEIILNNLKNQ